MMVGPYITARAVFRLYPILGRNLTSALFSIFVSAFSLMYVATSGYATDGMYIAFHAMLACDRVIEDAPMPVRYFLTPVLYLDDLFLLVPCQGFVKAEGAVGGCAVQVLDSYYFFRV